MIQTSNKSGLSLRRLLLPAIVLLLVALEVTGIFNDSASPLERVELAARDAMFRLRGEQVPAEEIVIVAIDDFSFNWTGYQWPWPRAYLAEIVDWLNEAGAQVIGLDVFLFEADPAPGGDEALGRRLERAQDSVNVIQIYDYREEVSPGQYVVTRTIKLPLAVYRPALDSTGITSIWRDDDAIARSVQAYQVYGEEAYIHWAFEIARLYLDIDPASALTPQAVGFAGRQAPLQGGRLLINYAGPSGAFPTYSAARVVLGDYDPALFDGKIVLIGATTMTLQDVYPTPFSASVQTPGVEIVANTIATILHNLYIHTLPPWASLLFTPVMALLAALINRLKRPSLALALMGGAMLAYGGVAYLVFVQFSLYLPTASPVLMLFLGVVLPTLEQAVSQELEKRRVRDMFTRFISPTMVDQLLATRDIASLNKRAELTILFSDIRGFTTMSEQLAPEQVVALLNPYLEAMTNVVHKYGGTVDKYEGDAIVAFFGEPVPYADHALRAARAAVEMRVVLAGLRRQWEAEGRLPGRFEIGIGLNSGEAFVGLLGSEKRINYTVIGDNVNLAARLQDLTKAYAWPIIISESTARAIQGEFETEFIESTQVRGKREPVNIHKILRHRDHEVQALEP